MLRRNLSPRRFPRRRYVRLDVDTVLEYGMYVALYVTARYLVCCTVLCKMCVV